MVFADSSLLHIPYVGRIFVIVSQYAHPTGTVFALASKLTLGSNLCEMVGRLDLTALELLLDKKATAIRDISNILYCMDDFGSDKLERRVEGVLQLMINHGNDLYPDIRSASRELSLARVPNNLSMAMSILVYVGAAFSALFEIRQREPARLCTAPHDSTERTVLLSPFADNPQCCRGRMVSAMDSSIHNGQVRAALSRI